MKHLKGVTYNVGLHVHHRVSSGVYRGGGGGGRFICNHDNAHICLCPNYEIFMTLLFLFLGGLEGKWGETTWV